MFKKSLFLIGVNLYFVLSIFAQTNIVWQSPVNVAVNGNELTGLAVGASAIAQQKIPANQDGAVEVTIGTGTGFYIGFSGPSGSGPKPNDVEFNLYSPRNYAYAYQGGLYKAWKGISVAGSKVKLSREGSTIKYYLDGTVFYTSPISPSVELTIYAYFSHAGGNMKNGVISSGGTPCSASGTACNDNNPATNNDVEDGSCNCAGTPCPASGTACDDNDPTTNNDVEDGNCNCAGMPSIGGGNSLWSADGGNDIIYSGGNVVIGQTGTNKPGSFKLYVEGGILTETVKVAIRNQASWADYVFDTSYQLNKIEEVDKFIKENQHLPNVPSAAEVAEEGFEVAQMDATLLRQIEELWLHMIELKKENEGLKKSIDELKKSSNK